jgi:hypothetical protein
MKERSIRNSGAYDPKLIVTGITKKMNRRIFTGALVRHYK